MLIGIDIGGTNLKLAIFKLSGKIVNKKIFKTAETEIEKNLTKFITQSKIKFARKKNIFGIGISVAGLLNKNKKLVNSPNLPNFKFSKFMQFLKGEFPNVPISIMNDANAAAIGEHSIGFKKKYSSIFLLTLGTGIGGAFINNHSLWEGNFGTASEIGHTCIKANGNLCNCGVKGCLESYFSGWAIKKRAETFAKLYPKSKIGKLEKITPLEISNLCRLGDKRSKEIFKESGVYLGIAMSNIINLINPETIILTGGLTKARKYFLPYSLQKCEELSLDGLFKKTKINIGKLGIWSGTYGSIQTFVK
tara:strand:- start:1410 stop:2327 length:918 start_codon:yes stop_codon:yes gene_type:complete